MSYLDRLKALDAADPQTTAAPFAAFEGWAARPHSEPVYNPYLRPFGPFEGSPSSRNWGKGARGRSASPEKPPLGAPSKATKGPQTWQDGLNRLVQCTAPKGVSSWAWTQAIRRAVAFCNDWGDQAQACGWTEEALFGLHPESPLLRFDAMGVSFLCEDAVVIAIQPDAVRFLTTSGATNRGRPPSNPQRAAWLGPWVVDADEVPAPP